MREATRTITLGGYRITLTHPSWADHLALIVEQRIIKGKRTSWECVGCVYLSQKQKEV